MNKTYGISKLNDEEILNKCYKYFEIMAKDNEISPDETREFLMLFLEFILRKNGINSNDYSINIFFPNKLKTDKFEAYLHYSEKQNKFDVYFLRDDMKFGRHNNRLYCKIDGKPSSHIGDYGVLHHYIYKVTISGHEFQHIVQVITNRALYEDYLRQRQEIYENFKLAATRDTFKILAKSANQNLDDIYLLHPIEIEANMLSYKYMLMLLNSLLKRTDDPKVKALLHTFIMDVREDREDKYAEYKEHDYSRERINAYANDISFEDDADFEEEECSEFEDGYILDDDDEEFEDEEFENAYIPDYDD